SGGEQQKENASHESGRQGGKGPTSYIRATFRVSASEIRKPFSAGKTAGKTTLLPGTAEKPREYAHG
ncbi:MAG: hypothetical protein AAGI08_13900, partial [Bacteroidota bacterium]